MHKTQIEERKGRIATTLKNKDLLVYSDLHSFMVKYVCLNSTSLIIVSLDFNL